MEKLEFLGKILYLLALIVAATLGIGHLFDNTFTFWNIAFGAIFFLFVTLWVVTMKKGSILWYISNVRFSKFFIDILFPFGITLLFVFGIEFIFKHTINHSHNVMWTSLGAIIVFGFVVILQNRMIEKIFGLTLREFIHETKNKHAVTKKFGARVLKIFTLENVTAFKLNNLTTNLKELLSDLESPSTGVAIPNEMYSVLLNESAEFQPDCFWAIWDLRKFALTYVFDNGFGNMHVTQKYAPQFNNLKTIYSKITKCENKRRMFIVSNNDLSTILSIHASDLYWVELKKYHKIWGFDKIHFCSDSIFNAKRASYRNACMDDYAYFELKLFELSSLMKYKKEWVIGMNSSNNVALLSGEDYVKDSKKLFEELISESEQQRNFISL